ncbi:MAG: hypothetical protein DRJ09_00270 [Bacteroidetes bacterium]|nr:MAG: hypothetical protein DRJ09_00270 [Bacteroidota bacterium]
MLVKHADLHAQNEPGATKAEGYVIDDKSGKPLPFVNIFFLNTTVGTTSGLDGKFKIKNRKHYDTLVFSMMGYHPSKVFTKPGKKYHLIIRLKEDTQILDEVVIKPAENPAHIILRKIIKNKHRNNPEKFKQFNCQTYTVLSATLTNVTKDNLKLVIPPPLIKTLPLTTDSLNRPVLPFYLSEKIADNYINKIHDTSQTVVIAKKVKGVVGLEDFDIEGYDNSLSDEMNFYKNYVDLFGHTFLSPLAKNGLLFYRYYLEDSTQRNGRKYYTIKFVPRSKKDLTFSGSFDVIKDLWAITRIDATLPKSANINYLNHLNVKFNFDFVNDTTLFFNKNSITASFHYFKVKNEAKNAMIEVKKTTIYSNILLGNRAHPLHDTLHNIHGITNDTSFIAYRNQTDSQHFNKTSQIIDSTNNLWWMKGAEKITNMFISGYFNVGKIDLGPYLGTFKRNSIEGTRFNLGVRTSEDFNPRYSLGGSAGYGFKDKEWKYSIYGQYKFNTKHRTIIGGGYIKDMYLFGVFGHIRLIKENMLNTGEDSFAADFFKRFNSDRRSMLYRINLYHEKEWRKGVSTWLSFNSDKLRQGLYTPFIHNGEQVKYIYNNSLSLRLRLSWKQKISDRFLRRYYLTTFYPIINIVGTIGRYRVASINSKYFKLHITIKQQVPMGFMRFKYVFEAGYIWGKVPYPMLEIIRGNDTYGDSKYRFNLLNSATAATDKYFSLMAEHHFNGLILNKVPLIKKFNIRMVVSAKYLLGSLSNKHQDILQYPWNMDIPGKHYLELGAGFENILQMIRVEGIWRLMPVNYPGMPYYGIRIRFDFSM